MIGKLKLNHGKLLLYKNQYLWKIDYFDLIYKKGSHTDRWILQNLPTLTKEMK